MPNIANEGADESSDYGSGQLAEAIPAVVAALRSTIAQCRRLAEEEPSIIVNVQATVREVGTPLHAAKFRFDLISIDQASPSRRQPM